jgi:hypothetical protein
VNTLMITPKWLIADMLRAIRQSLPSSPEPRPMRADAPVTTTEGPTALDLPGETVCPTQAFARADAGSGMGD